MNLEYLIDTDTFIYIRNHRPPQVMERFSSLGIGSAAISVVTYGELFKYLSIINLTILILFSDLLRYCFSHVAKLCSFCNALNIKK